jgi:hypothetical protein
MSTRKVRFVKIDTFYEFVRENRDLDRERGNLKGDIGARQQA